ncbi:MAG: hypothetical protein KY468_17335 [Armatimonadetes bacterium]|nr:hypothetical protein [Armatimonadota bacterium]
MFISRLNSRYLLFPLPLIAAVALFQGAPAPTSAQSKPVLFSRDILPILNKECRSCHVGSAAPGGYSVETPEKLLAGGRHGKAVVPGKSKESTLIKYMTGELKPLMPPGKPLSMETITLFRRWIDEGGKIDSMVETQGKAEPGSGATKPEKTTSIPPVPQVGAVKQYAPVTALAFSPDGTKLAAGAYRAVRIVDPKTGKILRTLNGPADQVLAVAWSSDGRHLAAAGGMPGATGELVVWDAVAWGTPKNYQGHADTISGIAWKPGAMEFATSSLDKTVKIWDAATGKETKTLKDHADPVYGVAYSPDGKWFASGSGDRSAKLYSTDNYSRAVTVFRHGDAVTALTFPKNDLLITASADKQARAWPVTTQPVENPLRSHGEGDVINAVAASADGDTFVWGASNKRIKVWNRVMDKHREDGPTLADWVYAVSASPDGQTVAAGAGDGKVYLWTQGEGRALGKEAKPMIVEPGKGTN